jgi:hypothetical protein
MWLARGIVAVPLIFGAGASHSAEEPPVVSAPTGPFRSMDDAIGWLKAKGSCARSNCDLVVRLAAQSSEGKPLDAYLTLIDIVGRATEPPFRTPHIAIRRRRTFTLSARDPAATLTTLKINTFTFGHDGYLREQAVRLVVRTATGDALFDVAFQVPPHEGHIDGAQRISTFSGRNSESRGNGSVEPMIAAMYARTATKDGAS